MKKFILIFAILIVPAAFVSQIPAVSTFISATYNDIPVNINRFMAKNVEEKAIVLVFPVILILGGLAIFFAIKRHKKENREKNAMKIAWKEEQERLQKIYDQAFKWTKSILYEIEAGHFKKSY